MHGSDCGYEFAAKDLLSKLLAKYNIEMTSGGLNNYLKKLASVEDITILRRIAKGVYRFNDPRMPSYVKIVSVKLLSDQ